MNYDHEILALTAEEAEAMLPWETTILASGLADLRNESGIIERH